MERQVPLGEPVGQNQPKTKEVKMKDKLTSLIVNLTEEFISGKISKEGLWEEIQRSVIPMILEGVMRNERDIYLVEHPGEYANGYYSRRFYYKNAPMDIKVPRTRTSNFYPSAIPRYSRYLPEEYGEMIESLFLSSRSLEGLKMTLKRLGLPVSSEEIDNMAQSLADEYKEFTGRELSSDWLIVYIDAKEIEVKSGGKVKKMVIISGIGVNMEGKKELLGSLVFEGRETLSYWREFLLDLKNRGVTRVLLFVTDDFPGLIKLIQGLFPLSMHQLCIVHLIRNAKLHLSKEEFVWFKERIEAIEKADEFDTAYTEFIEMVEKLKSKHPHFSKHLKTRAEAYVTFTKFPKEIRARIKSTNASENLHKELEKIRINSGGYFQSKKILYAKWFVFIKRLKSNRWKNPEPRFKGCLNKLHAMFYETFESDYEKS